MSTRQNRCRAIGTLLAFCLGCSSGAAVDLSVSELGQTTVGREATDDVGLPVVGELRSRKHTIIIYSAPAGPRFTVHGTDGLVIATALTADEMRERHPDIYETYKSTFAQGNSSLDASVDVSGGATRPPSDPLVDFNDLPAHR